MSLLSFTGPLPPSVPTFLLAAPVGSGLDLLAAADLASKSGVQGATPTAGLAIAALGLASHPLADRGPYNLIALVSARVAKKVMHLEFVEMTEIVAEDVPQGTRSAASSRPPITNISRWVEGFSVMAAILNLRYPEKATEFLVYQALIVRSERNYEGHQRVLYDRQFRREALARQDLNWSVVNSRLYSETFTGRAKAIPRCPHCLSDDHMQTTCIRNLSNIAVAAGIPLPALTQCPVHVAMAICRNFNEWRCRKPQCKYQHLCLSCNEGHPYTDCPRRHPPPRHWTPVELVCQTTALQPSHTLVITHVLVHVDIYS